MPARKYPITKYRGKFYRKCPQCNDIMYYKGYNSWRTSLQRKCMCRRCGYKKLSKLNNKKYIIYCHICAKSISSKVSENRKYCSKKCASIGHKTTMRQIYLKKMEKFGKLSPFYNPNACKLFETINKTMGWNGKHAENGGEVNIDGYWLDYYEPNLNIVIEYDEPHHNTKYQISRDLEKQKYIVNKLKCKFYRIKAGEDTHWRTIIS